MSRTAPTARITTTATKSATRPAHDARPLDWNHAVDVAAARLEESWVRPDLTGFMASSGLAGEFAATLCAYGMVAGEVAHRQGRDDEPRGVVAAAATTGVIAAK